MTRIAALTAAGLLTAVSFALPSAARADRPAAPYLLPEQTLAYLRIADVPDLVERFQETAIGRISSDDQIKPLIGNLYGSAVEAFSRFEERIGTELDELLRIPQGEVCLALVPPEQGPPQLVAFVEVGEQMPVAERLLERLDDELRQAGASRERETVGEVEIDNYRMPGRSRQLSIFTRDETVVVATMPELSKQLLQVWDGGDDFKKLAENRKFTSIMNRCAGSRNERPQVTWFFDPIALAKLLTRGNFSGQATLATATGLGADGVDAIGGSFIFATEEFDSIIHTHMLIRSPREGIVKMLALDSGDTKPEPWVPTDVVSYTTFNWDIDTTLNELVRLYDFFRGEGAWDEQVVGQMSEQLDADFETEILGQVEGRATVVTWLEPPARLNSQATLIGIRLNKASAFRRTLERITDKFGERFAEESYAGVTIYKTAARRRNNRSPDDSITRIPQPCVAIVGDYLLLADSVKLMQQAVVAKRTTTESLSGEIEFKLIASRIKRQLGEAKAGMISFNRPEEGYRALYGLAASKDVRKQLSERADANPFFKALDKALKDNPLPPFSVLAQYLAPAGAMLTNDETGFHYTAFALRRD